MEKNVTNKYTILKLTSCSVVFQELDEFVIRLPESIWWESMMETWLTRFKVAALAREKCSSSVPWRVGVSTGQSKQQRPGTWITSCHKSQKCPFIHLCEASLLSGCFLSHASSHLHHSSPQYMSRGPRTMPRYAQE